MEPLPAAGGPLGASAAFQPARKRSTSPRRFATVPHMSTQEPAASGASAPVRHLSPIDAICVVVGIVVGAGIYKTPWLVALNTSTGGMMLLAWAAGGLLCLCGALSYAELATAYPHVGGEYTYLSRAFGATVGFLFVWARAAVIQTGSIAALAYIYGDYAARLLPMGPAGPMLHALIAIVVLTACNALGLRTGKWTQNALTAAKVAGVAAIAFVGLIIARPAGAEPAPAAAEAAGPGLAGFSLAMVFVLYTFGGWNEAAYVAGEVRRRRRNMLWVLVGSIVLLTVLYLAVNLAYLRVLGMSGIRSSRVVAADTMRIAVGEGGAAAVSVLVAASALGAVNGCIFTGARALCALADDYPTFGPLGRWHPRLHTPVVAIVVQSAIIVALIVLPRLGEQFRQALGGGFEAAVEYTAPVFWAFLLLTGVAVFVLRARDPAAERTFRVPLMPVTVGLFCLMCGYMLYSSVAYTKAGALVGVGVLLAGVPVYLLCRRRSRPA